MYSLSVHSIHHLDINLQLVEREQHPLSAVRTPPQINQIDLERGGEMFTLTVCHCRVVHRQLGREVYVLFFFLKKSISETLLCAVSASLSLILLFYLLCN